MALMMKRGIDPQTMAAPWQKDPLAPMEASSVADLSRTPAAGSQTAGSYFIPEADIGPETGIGAIPNPNNRDGTGKVRNPNLWEKFRDNDNISAHGLMAMGAGLLSEPNFFAGLGKGALAYQNVREGEIDKAQPKLTADGAFTYQIDRKTGQPTFQRTPVADYNADILDRKLKATDALGRYRADLGYQAVKDRIYSTEGINADNLDFKRDQLKEQGAWHRDLLQNNLDVARINAENRAALAAANRDGRQVPVGALKEFDGYADKVSSLNGTLESGSAVANLLQNGTLKLGLFNNLRYKGAAATGIGADEGSRAYSQLTQFTQQLVNATLLDAKGVQTDGDAERAKIMTLVSSGDTQGALAEIQNAVAMVRRARDASQARATDIAGQYGIGTANSAPILQNKPTGRPSGSNGSIRSKYGLE